MNKPTAKEAGFAALQRRLLPDLAERRRYARLHTWRGRPIPAEVLPIIVLAVATRAATSAPLAEADLQLRRWAGLGLLRYRAAPGVAGVRVVLATCRQEVETWQTK